MLEIDKMAEKMDKVGLKKESKILRAHKSRYEDLSPNQFQNALEYTANAIERDTEMIADRLNGDHIAIREAAIRNFDRVLSDYNLKDLSDAEKIENEKERYAHKHIINDEQLKDNIGFSQRLISEQSERLGDLFQKGMKKAMGHPSDYRQQDQNFIKSVEFYKGHIDNNLDILRSIPEDDLTESLKQTRERSGQRLYAAQKEVEALLARVSEKYKEEDIGQEKEI